MDLEEFEVDHREVDTTTNNETSSLSIPDALKWIDAEWHITSKRARWMDLLGDYAGIEPFIIDGTHPRQCSRFVSLTYILFL